MSQIAYLDSAVWVSYIMDSEDFHYNKAEHIMQKIRDGTYITLVSKLVVMEVIDVIRKRIVDKEAFSGDLTHEKTREIKRRVDIKIKDFLNAVKDLENQGKIILVDLDATMRDILTHALKLLEQSFGRIITTSRCNACRRNMDEKYRYRGIGHYDIQHALIAKGSNASVLVSFDKSFRDLSTSTEFKTLKFFIPY